MFILSFFEVFPSIFMNFEQFSVHWYFCQNIYWCNFQYICKIQVSIYLYLLIFSSLSMYRFFFIFIGKWEIVLVMPRSGEKSTHNLCMFIYMRVWVKNNPIGQTNMHFDPHLKLLFKMTSFSFILYLLLNKKKLKLHFENVV